MSFLPGYGVRTFVNEVVVSAAVSGATMTHARTVSEVTTFVDTGARFIPGLKSGTLSLRGPHDSNGLVGIHAEILSSVGVDNALLVSVLPDGDAIGKPAMFSMTDPTDWAVTTAVADAVGFTLSAQSDESVDMGWVLHPNVAETANGNSASVDRGTVGTPSTAGAAAALHLTAYSGFTSVALKVQHSVDNSVWADLILFTAASGITSERKSVANGTTVNRYLRAVTAVTGAGSATFVIAIAPR